MKHPKIVTHVRDVPVRTLFLRFRHLGGDDRPLRPIPERVGDEKRVAANALNLLVG